MIDDDDDDKAEQGDAVKAESSQAWQNQLEAAEKDHKEWWDRADKCEKRYRAERLSTQKARQRRFNIFYANVETLRSTLYARVAKPDVRARFTQTRDPLSRTVSDMMERTLAYCADNTEHDAAFRAGVHERLVPGRGVVRLVYEPETKRNEAGQEVIVDQKVNEEFVYHKDFLHNPARCWRDVWWVAFRTKMTREDMEAAGFADAERVPLNWCPEPYTNKAPEDVPEDLRRAEVWEIWNKTKRQRLFVVKGWPTLLRVDDDPYGLSGFWPMAEPIQAVTGNETYIPTPDLELYIDQAEELDVITDRIANLTAALKRRGVYDASVKELRRLAKAGDNEFIPSENFGSLAANGGLKAAFQTEDLSPFVAVLSGLYQDKDMLIQSIYEITGISDILRGASNPNETATAQSIKASAGSARVRTSQREVQRWIRDTLRIKAEIIAEHFEPMVLMEASGIKLPTKAEVQQQAMQAMQQQAMQGQQPQVPPDLANQVTIDDVMGVLRSDKLRSYRIDIETDSTVLEDAESEKQSRTELLTAMSGFLQQWAPMAQMGGPPMVKLGFELLGFGVRGFKSGRQVEEALDEARDEIMQQASQPPPEPQPDPALEVEKIKAQATEIKAKADVQKAQIGAVVAEAKGRQDLAKMAAMGPQPIGPQPVMPGGMNGPAP